MTESDQTPLDSRLRWYQRTWLWVVVAFAAVPLTWAWFILGAVFDVNIFRLLGLVSPFLIPVGLWMGALVARRGWARGILSTAAVILLFLSAWAVWNYNQSLESEVFEACQTIETPEGELVELDPELCETLFDGSLEALQRTVWIVFAVFWVAPFFALYFLRKRFQPDDRGAGNTAHIAEVVGWLLLTLGGLFLVLILTAAASNQSLGVGEALVGALLVGVPTVSGVLLMRWGRRRRASTPDSSDAE